MGVFWRSEEEVVSHLYLPLTTPEEIALTIPIQSWQRLSKRGKVISDYYSNPELNWDKVTKYE
jgi:hypothetical protein